MRQQCSNKLMLKAFRLFRIVDDTESLFSVYYRNHVSTHSIIEEGGL